MYSISTPSGTNSSAKSFSWCLILTQGIGLLVDFSQSIANIIDVIIKTMMLIIDKDGVSIINNGWKDDFGLLVLQKGRGTEVRAQGFQKVKKKETLQPKCVYATSGYYPSGNELWEMRDSGGWMIFPVVQEAWQTNHRTIEWIIERLRLEGTLKTI